MSEEASIDFDSAEGQLAWRDEFDSYFRAPAEILGLDKQAPLWDFAMRERYNAGLLIIAEGKSTCVPYEGPLTEPAPEVESTLKPAAFLSAENFYRLSLVCQALENSEYIYPENAEPPLDPSQKFFDIFIPGINVEDLPASEAGVPFILEPSACRDENRPNISLAIINQQYCSQPSSGLLLTVEYNGRGLLDDETIEEYLYPVGSQRPIHIEIQNIPELTMDDIQTPVGNALVKVLKAPTPRYVQHNYLPIEG
jgi:hypothetical protein